MAAGLNSSVSVLVAACAISLLYKVHWTLLCSQSRGRTGRDGKSKDVARRRVDGRERSQGEGDLVIHVHMASSSLVPRIIVLALGAGALGFPDALRVLLDVAGRCPLTDIGICVLAVAVVTTQALGALLLARFVRKAAAARAGGDAHAPPPRTDRFALLTLVVSLGVAFLVSACLLVASGVGAAGLGLGLLHLVAGDVARNSPVVVALATGAAVLLCTRPLLQVFHRFTGTTRGFASMTQVASFITGVAAAVGGRLTKLAPYLAVVSFALLCCLVLTTYAPLQSGSDGAKYP